MEAVQQVHCCTLLKIFKMCVNFIRKRSILQSGSGWVVFPKIASYLTTRFAFSKRGRGSGIAPPVTLYRFVSGGGSWNGFEESAQVSSHLSREGDGHGHRHHPHRCHGLLALNLFGFQKKKKVQRDAGDRIVPSTSFNKLNALKIWSSWRRFWRGSEDLHAEMDKKKLDHHGKGCNFQDLLGICNLKYYNH